ncbi:MAG: cardiolipin synthase [Clostridiales bacterium]|nr:cardiolipin synthase [Clostridiales bacterium]
MKKLSARKMKWIERTAKNNRSYKLYLYNRFFSFLLMVLCQIVGYVFAIYLIVYDSPAAFALQSAIAVLEIVVVLYLINKHDRPTSRLNWILLIMIAPIIGVPGYLLFGDGKPTRKMLKKINASKEEIRAQKAQALIKDGSVTDNSNENQACENGIEHYLCEGFGYRPYYNGDVTYYENGEKMFPEMLSALDSAEKYILLDYFIIANGKMWEEILKRLLQKAEQGVKIRIIYDDFGCMMTLPPNYDRYLETLHENIRCLTFNNVVPFFAVRMNNRDHRKILVVDGKTAFTGGINLADEYINEKKRFGYWKDTGIKITGESVQSFVDMFLCTWNAFRKDKEDAGWYLPPLQERDGTQNEEKFVIQPYENSPLLRTSASEAVYADMIQRAKRYIYIFTPYLILGDYLRTELLMAARRGVDVRIVVPGIPDKKMTYRLTRANYPLLMKAGVKIYEYTPGFIHAKGMVCDDEYAVVGTANFDYRSLYFHFEDGVYFTKKSAVAAAKRDADEVFAVSKLCTKENTKRSMVGRLFDSVLCVFETMF